MKPIPAWTMALRAAKSPDNTYRKSVGVIFVSKFESNVTIVRLTV